MPYRNTIAAAAAAAAVTWPEQRKHDEMGEDELSAWRDLSVIISRKAMLKSDLVYDNF